MESFSSVIFQSCFVRHDTLTASFEVYKFINQSICLLIPLESTNKREGGGKKRKGKGEWKDGKGRESEQQAGEGTRVENRYIYENKVKLQKKQKEERFRLPFPNWNKNLEKYCEFN